MCYNVSVVNRVGLALRDAPPVSTISFLRSKIMRITFYPLGAYNLGHELPFTINLDGLSLVEYNQALLTGLFEAHYPDGVGSVLSSRCRKCKMVSIGNIETECSSCGNDDFEIKHTDKEWMVYASEDIPEKYVGKYSLDEEFFEYVQFLKDTSLEPKIVDAGLTCGLDLCDIEKAYQGTYDSDAMFAERYAVMNGKISDSETWPFHYIDWKDAAAELMHNYTESNQHYFYRPRF